jgi:hypothetical protein
LLVVFDPNSKGGGATLTGGPCQGGWNCKNLARFRLTELQSSLHQSSHHSSYLTKKQIKMQRKRPAAGGAAALQTAPPQAGRPSSVPEGSASPHGEATSKPVARAKQCKHLSFKHARVNSWPNCATGVIKAYLRKKTPRRRRGGCTSKRPAAGGAAIQGKNKKRPTAW